MDNKERFKLGTFVKNTIFGKPQYLNLISDLGIDRRTDPVFILEEAEQKTPEALYEIILLAQKTTHVKEFADKYLQETM